MSRGGGGEQGLVQLDFFFRGLIADGKLREVQPLSLESSSTSTSALVALGDGVMME